MGYDVVIVGGEATGAVMARRLSESADRRVLLLEAGPADAPATYPDPLRRPDLIGRDAAHDWAYKSEPSFLGRSFVIPRGKVLGGSAAINGSVAMRAPKVDHDRWAREHDLEGWSWEETRADGDGRVRGIRNLRVVDASMFPDVPSVATHVSILMAAEHIAAGIVG